MAYLIPICWDWPQNPLFFIPICWDYYISYSFTISYIRSNSIPNCWDRARGTAYFDSKLLGLSPEPAVFDSNLLGSLHRPSIHSFQFVGLVHVQQDQIKQCQFE